MACKIILPTVKMSSLRVTIRRNYCIPTKIRMKYYVPFVNFILILILYKIQTSRLLQAEIIEPEHSTAQALKRSLPFARHQVGYETSASNHHHQTRRRDSEGKSFLSEPMQQKEDDKLKVLGLIRGTRELLSPPSLNSLYNYINKGPDYKKAKQTKLNSQRTMPNLTNQQNYNQLAAASIRPHDYSQRAVALGRENELMTRPVLEQNGFVSPLLMHSGGHELSASNIIGVPTMFEQSLQSNQQEQNLINLYPENMLNPGRDLQTYNGDLRNLRHQHGDLVEHLYTKQNPTFNQRPNVYSGQISGVSTAPDASGRPKMGQIRPDIQTENKDKLQQQIARKKGVHGRATPLERPREVKQNDRGRLLSNDQLISLIDELKEFNSRQASRIQSNGLASPNIKMAYPKYDKDSEHSSSLTMSKVDSSPEAQNNPPASEEEEEDGQDNQKPAQEVQGDGKMSTDDLAKFAKFLMTKEGADMKFQLGLEKESPDDGDEDDERDTLLETKNKQLQAKPKEAKKQRLEEVDKTNSKAAVQLDQQIDHLAEKTKELERSGRNEENSVPKQVKDDNTLEDGVRKRRNQDGKTTTASASAKSDTVIDDGGKKKGKNTADRNHEGNFAKMLIDQEILEDQQESSGSSPSSTVDKRSNKRNNNKVVAKKDQKQTDKRDSDDSGEVKDDRGEQVYEYPRKERNKDHIALIHEMQKAKKNKMNTRSRIHLPVDSILKRAMEGDLGIQTERTSDGKLSLRGPNRDAVVTLDLAEKGAGNNQANEDVGENNSELVPSQIEPDKADGTHAINRVHLQSNTPLKDEYPISERVSDRLNKLSYNLDRYFNDGFLKEIESKSKLDGDSNQSPRPQPQPQAQSSNVDFKKAAHSGKQNSQTDKDDRDFDIDVTIDGKREKDDDDDKEDDDSEVVKSKGGSVSKVAQKSLHKSGKAAAKGKNLSQAKKKAAGKRSNVDSEANKRVVGKVKKVELEADSKSANLDPVENESLETPIGPDGDVSETPETNAKKSKSSSESKISTSYKKGKKTTGKFYEEPDWR